MFDYSKCMNRMIFCIDLCSFFASCACVMRGLDPLKVKLAVVGDVNRKGSIVLACT
ncbi:damage repair protein, partial [Bacillus pseudomycoides]